ncbi:Type II secretion system (T2SS), protein K [Klenkia marina]|uniref:Type II secretion system (T2SS), protein K n=1 Tax=Klenkia marina TaxID=1960309 RepID=A0A1G4YSK6_9ACTN|nr:hypothetical protein [Klenkia marina]SCX56427.1 Type II secretion system (T2SS), protein K [Klenkia marina]
MTANRPGRGVWYLLLAVLSFGFLACVPFWHAAQRLQRADVRRWAVAFTAVTGYLVVLAVLTPRPAADGTPVDSAVSTLGGFSALIAMVVAAVRLNGLRREVYAAPAPVPAPPVPADPAVAAVLAGRQKRADARDLLARDRSMARELGIGRPDLGRGYDDGGLVDINTAPVQVIAQRCDLTPEQAAAVVAAREARAGFFNVDEMLIDVPLPADVGDRIRERAFV